MIPVLKYPGGKRGLIDEYSPYFPLEGARHDLVEPMCGAAALSLAWHDRWEGRTFISDASADLMGFYRAVKTDGPHVCEQIRQLALHYNSRPPEEQSEFFYEWRGTLNRRSVSPVTHAALYWMFNRTCFNGLPRYNLSGGLNTPWGKVQTVRVVDFLGKLMQLHVLLVDGLVVELSSMGFDRALELIPLEGTIVFLDPPYHGAWAQYTAGGFDWDDQVRLAAAARRVLEAGGLPYVCNSDTEEVRALYEGLLQPIEVRAPRAINSDGGGRGEVAELLLVPPGMAP